MKSLKEQAEWNSAELNRLKELAVGEDLLCLTLLFCMNRIEDKIDQLITAMGEQ